jgi:hypothetical protein
VVSVLAELGLAPLAAMAASANHHTPGEPTDSSHAVRHEPLVSCMSLEVSLKTAKFSSCLLEIIIFARVLTRKVGEQAARSNLCARQRYQKLELQIFLPYALSSRTPSSSLCLLHCIYHRVRPLVKKLCCELRDTSPCRTHLRNLAHELFYLERRSPDRP